MTKARRADRRVSQRPTVVDLVHETVGVQSLQAEELQGETRKIQQPCYLPGQVPYIWYHPQWVESGILAVKSAKAERIAQKTSQAFLREGITDAR